MTQHTLPQLPVVEHAHPHTPASFVRDFHQPEAEVRAWVNWDKLLTTQVTVEEHILHDKEAIGKLETVWYHYADGSPAEWHHQHAYRTLIREVPELMDRLPGSKSAAEIRLFLKWLQTTPEDTILSVPAYRTEENQYILLDGNHRTSAIYQSPQHIGLRVISIGGINDPELSVDMIHAKYGSASADAWQAQCQRLRDIYR